MNIKKKRKNIDFEMYIFKYFEITAVSQLASIALLGLLKIKVSF